MRSTFCALGVAGEYREHQLVVATGVVSVQLGKFGGENTIVLKCV
jgi:hypothetical protein